MVLDCVELMKTEAEIRSKIAAEVSWWLERRDYQWTESQLLTFIEEGAYAELGERIETTNG